jgi:hypothetical protein
MKANLHVPVQKVNLDVANRCGECWGWNYYEGVTVLGICPHCGRPDAQVCQVVSRHATANGMTVWLRCGCGSLQVRLITAGGVEVLARGNPG